MTTQTQTELVQALETCRALREVLADLVAFHYGNPRDEDLERMADKYDAADIPDSRTLELNMAAHARAVLAKGGAR